MRLFLSFVGWSSVLGGLFDGAIAAWLGVLIALGQATPDIAVDVHLRDHLPFLYWVKPLAFAVLPDAFARWVFALPALVYFPIRILVSAAIGAWALAAVRRRGGGSRAVR
ncbi:MAG: hypothetical protein ACFB00_03680 [Parvularculaceae bacterium]